MKSFDLLMKAKHEVDGTSIYVFSYDELKDYVNLLISEAWKNLESKPNKINYDGNNE